jgi:hypothetical protein
VFFRQYDQFARRVLLKRVVDDSHHVYFAVGDGGDAFICASVCFFEKRILIGSVIRRARSVSNRELEFILTRFGTS